MGVYIKDFKLPKACVECPFCIKYQVSSTYCNLLEADINPKKARIQRAEGCKMIDFDLRLEK